MLRSRDDSKSEPLWQDRDVRFDASAAELRYRVGERLIKVFERVEDTKGNNGDLGNMQMTTLRLIWQSREKPRINLTIGLGCVTSLTQRTLHTKLRGKNDALYMMTKVAGTRYEFIFTLVDQSDRPGSDRNPDAMISTLSKVCKSYATTKLYRDLKLRTQLVNPFGKELRLLPAEQIYNKIDGVWNLSSDQGNLGTMYVTSVRIVWHANMNDLFNISLPYIQITAVKIRESKFGVALVIESSEVSGGYVLGFRLDPLDRLHALHQELLNLYSVHTTTPTYGVLEGLKEIDESLSVASIAAAAQSEKNGGSAGDAGGAMLAEGDVDLAAGGSHDHDPVAAYLASTATATDNQVVYCHELGLAVEKMKDGFTLDSLWQIIPPN